jgi:uncharacterized membrane protein
MSCQLNLAKSTPGNAGFLIMARGAMAGTTPLQHSDYITAPGKFVTGAVGVPSSVNQKIQVHGALNILGWGILLPLGVMVARYARSFDPAWFYTHIVFQILGFVCIIGGIVTGFDVGSLVEADGLGAHQALGVFLLVLASLQVTYLPRFKIGFSIDHTL